MANFITKSLSTTYQGTDVQGLFFEPSEGSDDLKGIRVLPNVKVKTKSLNDIFVEFFNSSPIDYMSVDTEGSELDILSNFDFDKFGPSILTVEHNFTALQDGIDKLLFANGYVRRFKDFTAFDAWYIRPNAFE